MEVSAFRTVIDPEGPRLEFPVTTRILVIGSCFAEHVGAYFRGYKLPHLLNPNGIVYNPLAIGAVLDRMLTGRSYEARDLIEHDGLFHSFGHHGRFSHPDREICLDRINLSLEEAVNFLRMTDVIILTLGTAFAYRFKKTGTWVANCHKLPPTCFDRELLSLSDMLETFRGLIGQLIDRRPELRLVVSVSPVRHLRDSARLNQVSKARLIGFTYQLDQAFPSVRYFPSYELMLDDLRDYRFYAEDLVHPSDLAVKYIWDRFAAWCFETTAEHYFNEMDRIVKKLAHRPRNPASSQHAEFVAQCREDVAQFSEKYPHVDFSRELAE